MTLLRLEILRIVRTRRWMLVIGVYAFFGLAGPLLARYVNEILERFGGDEIVVTGHDPQPIDGIVQFVSNASQLGILAVIVVAAGSLAIDARPEIAAFLRTRVSHSRALLFPRLVVVGITAVVALVVGTAVAWGMTASLLGALPAGAMVIGTFFGGLYLVVVVAIVAAMATFTRSVVGTVFASLAVVIVMPIVALAPAVAPWLPSELLAAVAGLVDGEPVSTYTRATITSILAVAALVAVAVRHSERREL